MPGAGCHIEDNCHTKTALKVKLSIAVVSALLSAYLVTCIINNLIWNIVSSPQIIHAVSILPPCRVSFTDSVVLHCWSKLTFTVLYWNVRKAVTNLTVYVCFHLCVWEEDEQGEMMENVLLSIPCFSLELVHVSACCKSNINPSSHKYSLPLLEHFQRQWHNLGKLFSRYWMISRILSVLRP